MRLLWSPIHYVAPLRGSTLFLASHSPLDGSCRNAGVDRPGLQISRGYRTEAKHGSLADVHSRRHRITRTHPGICAHTHGEGNEWEGRVVVIVRGAADVGLLRNDGVRPHGYGRRVIYLRLIAQRRTIGAY